MSSRSIFVFSSPLQFLFSTLIAEKISSANQIEGYYYFFQRDFKSIYQDISKYLDSDKLVGKPLEELDIQSITQADSLYLGNRFNINERTLFQQFTKKSKNVYLYEEGFNTYLPHHFNNPRLNDQNFLLRIKNNIKLLIGKIPSHIRLNSFKKVYSVFPIDSLRNQSKWNKIDFLNTHIKQIDCPNTCIFLLQTLSEDNLINEEKITALLKAIIHQLKKQYSTIYIKPHPRNDGAIIKSLLKESKTIKLLPVEYRDLPAEIFLAKHRMDVIGFSSSSLLYAKTLFHLNSYHCLDRLVEMDNNEKLIKFYNSIIPLFKKHNILSYNLIH